MSSSSKKPFKIKVLPKKGEAAPHAIKSRKAKKERRLKKGDSDSSGNHLGILFLVIGLGAAGALYVLNNSNEGSRSKGQSVTNQANKKLTRYLQDGQKKAELQSLEVQVENLRAFNSTGELPAFLPLDEEKPEDQRNLGVELEPDPSMDRIYDELYGASPGGKWMSPEERISARLAEKKWLYNYEKEEKKMYIRNFIEAAREAGYDIQINDDLIVTQVKPITSRPKIPLDKVIENLQFAK